MFSHHHHRHPPPPLYTPAPFLHRFFPPSPPRTPRRTSHQHIGGRQAESVFFFFSMMRVQNDAFASARMKTQAPLAVRAECFLCYYYYSNGPKRALRSHVFFFFRTSTTLQRLFSGGSWRPTGSNDSTTRAAAHIAADCKWRRIDTKPAALWPPPLFFTRNPAGKSITVNHRQCSAPERQMDVKQ